MIRWNADWLQRGLPLHHKPTRGQLLTSSRHRHCLRRTTAFPILQNFVGGRWTDSTATTSVPVFNPSTGGEIARAPLSPEADVDAAVRVAAAAFPAWKDTPVFKRAAVMFQYKALLEAHFAELSQLITRENGKTLAKAQGDLRRGIEVVEFACGVPHLLKGETLPQVAAGIDGASAYEPLGVCGVITPFNFPAMVPMWMFPLAIACGNCFVLKPSEKVPLTANRLAELFAEAGLPPGVFSVVHGGREVVEALCTHPGVNAVGFVGSSAVAEHVYQLGSRTGRRVQAAGGAKNVMLVMPDAEPDSSVRAIMDAAFGCAGQRCMAGSIVMGVGDADQGLVDRPHAAADALRVLPTDRAPESEMGPVIDGAARDRLFGLMGQAAGEGAQVVHDGRHGTPGGFFVGPTLVDHVMPGMSLARNEHFGPVLVFGRPKSLDAAIDWINGHNYGNDAVIFTSHGGAAREFARRVQCGMIGVITFHGLTIPDGRVLHLDHVRDPGDDRSLPYLPGVRRPKGAQFNLVLGGSDQLPGSTQTLHNRRHEVLVRQGEGALLLAPDGRCGDACRPHARPRQRARTHQGGRPPAPARVLGLRAFVRRARPRDGVRALRRGL